MSALHIRQPDLRRLFADGIRAWLIALLCMVAFSLMVDGCATYKQNAGKLLASTALTVDAAMRSWATVVKTGKITDEQQARVKSAYERYQLAMGAADAAYTALMTLGDKSAWPVAAAQLNDASVSLTSMIQTYKQ